MSLKVAQLDGVIRARRLFVAGLALLILARVGARADDAPAPLNVVGEVEKVCQLTGDTDWETGRPTAARTFSNYGLDGTDLGYPVELDGRLFLLFGDSWPPLHPAPRLEDAVPGDAVGVIVRTTPPSADGDCVGLSVNQAPGSPPRFAPATLVGAPTVKQGFFNVPSGGIGQNDRLYAFFWTHHCALPSDLEASPDRPLARPAPSAACPETEESNSVGESVLAWSDDEGRTFGHAVPAPPGFVYVTAAQGAAEGEVFIFGAPRYRASLPYLAEAAANRLADPKSWRFFVGRDARGGPKWVSYSDWSGGGAAPDWRAPADAALYADEAGGEACVGEFSITFNRPLDGWLLLYNCRGEIEARIAEAPWGPWSSPTPLLSRSVEVECRWLMGAGGCGDRRDFWSDRRRNGRVVRGGFYAPFALDRFTRPAPGPRKGAVIYWLVSTWNPYEVLVMRTRLQQ